MMKRFLLLPLLCLLCSFVLKAQVPIVPDFPGYHPYNGPDVRMCSATIWAAGTSTQMLDATMSQSNDVEYLCFSDVLNITHNADFNLDPSGDPIAGTTPGISYVFYDCPPVNTGPDVVNVENDPCVTNDPLPTTSPYDFYLVSDANVNVGGSGSFTNNGVLQTFFNGGDPLELYFAPITIHNHPGLQFESAGSNEFCINVTTSDAFRVVYLNEILASNINNNAGGACLASFEINGGLSEFDQLNGGASNYAISITQVADPTVTGSVTSGGATHGSTVTFSVPAPGMYDVNVEDGKSCGTTFTVDMSACVASLSATYTETDITCNGADDGSVLIDIMGGTAPFNFDWQLQPGGVVQSGTLPAGSQFTITGLAQGTYGITVTDNGSTQDIASVTINEPSALGASLVNLTQPTCNGESTGSISVEVSVGGVVIVPDMTYSFDWGASSTQTTQTITSIPSGPYSVIVTDGNGCTASASATLSQPAAITAPPITGVDASCIGVADGTATIVAMGGTGSLTYAWSTVPVQTNATATSLEPGTYTVTCTDTNMCTYTDNVTIGAATVLTVTANPTDISCNGANDGQITAVETVVGIDNGGYNYIWSPIGTGSNATVTGLSANTYSVTVTDANGCSATSDAVINEPAVLTVTATAIDESCSMGNDGSVSTVVTGGTPDNAGNYNYSWTNAGVTDNISGLSANTYTVTVTDENNCMVTASDIVNPPTGPTIQGITVVGIQCATDTNGSLTANAVAGNDPIDTYTWSTTPVQTTAAATNLGPGTYTVSVTDTGGCVTTATETISAPPALAEQSAAVITTPFCPGGGEGTITLDIVGGVPPYNYNWSNGSTGPAFGTLTNLIADTYNVTVTDANFCTLEINGIVVNDPPAITVLFSNVQPVSCFAGIPCDGSATIAASGGLSTTYTFIWDNGESATGGSSTATQLCQGDHMITVTDGFCTQVFTMGVDEVPAPPVVSVADIATVDASCFGDTDGSATVTPTGGDGGPYVINWSNGQSGVTATNLTPGLNYDVTITDGQGCVSVPFNVSVGEPALLELVLIDTVDIGCNGEDNGIIQVAPQGGNTGTFTYQWSPNTSNTQNVASGLSAGDYSVTVTDEKGCTATIEADVDEPEPLVFEYIQPEEPLCNGYTTVFSLDTVYGGSGAPYLYTIDEFNFQSSNQATPMIAGTYTIEVSDATGCTASQTLVVDEPAPIIVDLGPDVEIELGESYEIIPNVTPLGALDSLMWTPSTSLSCDNCFNPIANPIDDQVYTLTVTDEFGCFGSDDILIDIDPNRNVYIPNVFTPNADGANDFFAPFTGVGVDNINNIMIFDRWGELVYQVDDFMPDGTANNGWDGRFGGKLMNSAVFIYVIEIAFVDGEVLTYKGDVTLLR